jgi:hypothetical protein
MDGRLGHADPVADLAEGQGVVAALERGENRLKPSDDRARLAVVLPSRVLSSRVVSSRVVSSRVAGAEGSVPGVLAPERVNIVASDCGRSGVVS